MRAGQNPPQIDLAEIGGSEVEADIDIVGDARLDSLCSLDPDLGHPVCIVDVEPCCTGSARGQFTRCPHGPGNARVSEVDSVPEPALQTGFEGVGHVEFRYENDVGNLVARHEECGEQREHQGW